MAGARTIWNEKEKQTMKRGRILNRELSDALNSMGHGDWLVITDAGFPIPEDGRAD